MCIIAHSPAGVELPAYQYRKNMFGHNDDGAGFAYIKDKVVHWEKGFMTFEDFEEALQRVSSTIDTKETEMVFHYRIGTHGGNIPQNTHPFIISQDYSEMKKLTGKTRNAIVFHNGIINSVNVPSNVSDTMAWIHDRLYYLYAFDKRCLKNPLIIDMISKDIGSSKLAIMTPHGVQRIGHFIEENGNYYSNSTYSYKVSNYVSYTNYNPYCLPWKNDDGEYDTPVYNYKKVTHTFYRLNKNVKNKVFVETQADVYDIAEISQDIFVSFSADYLLVGDYDCHVQSNATLVNNEMNKLTMNDICKLGVVEWGRTIKQYQEDEEEVVGKSEYKIQYIDLKPKEDELWDLNQKRVYNIVKNCILTEDDEVFIFDRTSGMYKYADELNVGHKDDKGVFRITCYDELTLKGYEIKEVSMDELSYA